LASEGCISIFTDKTWKVINGSLVIVKGEKVGTLYLCTDNTNSSIYLASIGVDTTLWHHRLGHMSEKGMQILVVKGFAQKKGIGFDEIFSPIIKMTSIRTILSPVAVEDLHLEQLDVKTTFLYGDLEEEIYMQQP
jgi:hypothetical protein